MQALGYNPLHCMQCNLEVSPESLSLPHELVDPIVAWRSVYDALDRLWLDSGSYEEWAAQELGTLRSDANRRGRALRDLLEPVRRCYYWLFTEQNAVHAPSSSSAESRAGTQACPDCGGALTLYATSRIPQAFCDACSLVVDGDRLLSQ
jgi:predicted  nucleic acid-binding Zn ribbon protein